MQKVNKEEAIKLRIEGNTYKQIAESLNCSVVWCKKNLSNVKQDNIDSQMLDNILYKGLSSEGITRLEIYSIIKENYHSMDNESINLRLDRIVASMKYNNKQFLIRPVWMLPDSPQHCTNAMMDMAQDINETLRHCAKKYVKFYDLPESSVDSVMYELARLASPSNTKALPGGLLHYGDYLGKVISKLEERNNETE